MARSCREGRTPERHKVALGKTTGGRPQLNGTVTLRDLCRAALPALNLKLLLDAQTKCFGGRRDLLTASSNKCSGKEYRITEHCDSKTRPPNR